MQVSALGDLLGDEQPEMIKMDMQGFVTEVLRGIEAVFGASQQQVELIKLKGLGVRYVFDVIECRDRLEYWGSHLCGYDSIMRKLQPQVTSDVDLQRNSLYCATSRTLKHGSVLQSHSMF